MHIYFMSFILNKKKNKQVNNCIKIKIDLILFNYKCNIINKNI